MEKLIDWFPPITNPRTEECNMVIRLLMDNPLVFVWAHSGHGKTTFARALKENATLPTQLVHCSALLGDFNLADKVPVYEKKINPHNSILIVDEFDSSWRTGLAAAADKYISDGHKLVLLVHESKRDLTNPKRPYWLDQQGDVIELVNRYPKASWLRLAKYKS